MDMALGNGQLTIRHRVWKRKTLNKEEASISGHLAHCTLDSDHNQHLLFYNILNILLAFGRWLHGMHKNHS